MPNLFGFSFGKNNKDLDSSIIKPDGTLVNPSFVPPEVDDGSTVVGGGGHYGQYLDLDGSVRNDGFSLTIRAEEGEGKRPRLIPAVASGGQSDEYTH